jgi:hypothetical protein
MKKILLLIVALSVIAVSCNKLFDIEPADAISSDMAIKDKSGVIYALRGSYNSLQAVGLYGRNMVIVGDLAADNLVWTGTTQDYGQLGIKPIPADNGIVDGMWSACYDGINRVNNILYQLPGINNLNPDEYNKFEGEALFLRGLLYLNLTNYFGGVPIRTMPTIDLNSIDMAKSTPSQVMDQILSDLTNSIKSFNKMTVPVTPVKGFAHVSAATALRAKVWLTMFHQTGTQAYADSAIADANRVIESGYQLENTYKTLFTSEGASSESIFEIAYDLQNFNRLAQYFYSRKLTGRYEIAPSPGFIQGYEASDLRQNASIAYDETNKPYVIKYNDVAGGTDRVYVLRLAEMFLIRAEARAYSNGDISSIQNDINTVRNRAGLPNVIADNITDLKQALEKEFRYEFAFEGHRWNDLVRTKRASQVLGIDEKYTLFPIPLSELQTNKKMEPNPGY